MNILKKLFCHKPITYIVSISIFVILSLLYLIINGFNYFVNYIDAFTIAGFVDIFVGGLVLVTKLGAFNTFGYGIAKIFGNRKGYEDLYDYNERKTAAHKGSYSFAMYIFVGIIGLLISVILMLF